MNKRFFSSSLFLLLFSFFFLFSCHNPYMFRDLESLYYNRPENFAIVTFDANNATRGEAPGAKKINKGESIIIPGDNGLVRTGYIYYGWNTQANGQGSRYIENDVFTPESNITLYAEWIPITYTIIYDKNADDDPLDKLGTTPQSIHTYDVRQALNKNLFDRYGYTFTHWNTEADDSGDTYYDSQEVINLSAIEDDEVTLYAQWVENRITLTLDIEEIMDGTPNVDGGIIISKSGAGSLEVTHEVMLLNPAQYDPGSIRWEIYGVGAHAGTIISGSGGSFVLDASDVRYNSTGGHTLRLEVKIDGIIYQKNILFKIEE
jgi:uncharacterized repeat protein (TIGR02543 family)